MLFYQTFKVDRLSWTSSVDTGNAKVTKELKILKFEKDLRQ